MNVDKHEFHKHLNETLNQIYNDDNGTKSFDVTITCNGKTATLEMNADLWNNLNQLIEDELG